MKINEKLIEKLRRKGWEVECIIPLEIRHEDGSFATLYAAEIIIEKIAG